MDAVVIDASSLFEVLAAGDGATLLGRLVGEADLLAPHLVDVEVLSAVRRNLAAGLIDETIAAAAVEALRDAPVDRVPVTPLLGRIWDLRQNLTPYDAAYVALAEHVDCPLVSKDGRLDRAPGHTVPVLSW